jgi:hypothetical protein
MHLLHRYTVGLARQWLAVHLSCTFAAAWGVASKDVHRNDGGYDPRNDRENDIRATGPNTSDSSRTALTEAHAITQPISLRRNRVHSPLK